MPLPKNKQTSVSLVRQVRLHTCSQRRYMFRCVLSDLEAACSVVHRGNMHYNVERFRVAYRRLLTFPQPTRTICRVVAASIRDELSKRPISRRHAVRTFTATLTHVFFATAVQTLSAQVTATPVCTLFEISCMARQIQLILYPSMRQTSQDRDRMNHHDCHALNTHAPNAFPCVSATGHYLKSDRISHS